MPGGLSWDFRLFQEFQWNPPKMMAGERYILDGHSPVKVAVYLEHGLMNENI